MPLFKMFVYTFIYSIDPQNNIKLEVKLSPTYFTVWKNKVQIG